MHSSGVGNGVAYCIPVINAVKTKINFLAQFGGGGIIGLLEKNRNIIQFP